MTDEPDAYDETHRHVNESIGASVSVDISRGTGTRDQEKWSLKGKGATAEAAIDELRTQLEAVVGDLDDEEPLAAQTREFAPELEEDDDE